MLARGFFNQLRQKFLDYNGAAWKSGEFARLESEIAGLLKTRQAGADAAGDRIREALDRGNQGKPA